MYFKRVASVNRYTLHVIVIHGRLNKRVEISPFISYDSSRCDRCDDGDDYDIFKYIDIDIY